MSFIFFLGGEGLLHRATRNVTDDHCHSRLRWQIFLVSLSGIILTVCFARKRALLAFWVPSASPKAQGSFFEQNIPLKWYHFERLGKSASGAVNGSDRRVTLLKRGIVSCARAEMYLAAKAQMYLTSTGPQILPPMCEFQLPSISDELIKIHGWMSERL